MNKLFPLRTFQQDAILKRLNEIVEAIEEGGNVFEGQLIVDSNVITIPEKDGLYQLVNSGEKVLGLVDIRAVNATVGAYNYCGFYEGHCFGSSTPAGQQRTTIDLSAGWYTHLPSTTSQIGKYLRVNSYGSLEWAEVSGGTTVVANPTLAGTESSLSGLQVGDTKYKVDQPIEVVANPTLAGTESDLTGLQVGNTKYKVPSGGSGGVHVYNVVYGSTNCIFRYVTDNGNITDEASLRADLLAKGCTSSKKYPLCGTVYAVTGETYQALAATQMYVNSAGDTLYVERFKYTYTVSNDTISLSVATETKNNLQVTIKKVF